MLLEDLAKDLVEVTSRMIGGRTINIMNTDGVIIASTDRSRIGSTHQGACEVIQTGRPVIIEKDQVARYPGAKEGYNMPLRVNGSIIGVVGMYGEPTEIQDLAHLLEVYMTKCYQVEAMLTSRLAAGELRERVIRCLLDGSDGSLSDAKGLMESLSVTLEFPVTVAVISQRSGMAVLSEQQEKLIRTLTQRQLLRSTRDLWAIMDDRLILFLSKFDPPTGKAQLLEHLADYRVSFGDPCEQLQDIRHAYHQAMVLDGAIAERINDIAHLSARCTYMLADTAAGERAFLERLERKLADAFSSDERKVILKTAQTYYDMDRSVGRAAAEVFIHKNTLQYRIRRLLDVLELTKCSPFQQEYIIRLLLEHQKG